MKTFIQWTLGTPQDWEEIDSVDWSRLPKKPDPTISRQTVDETKGWMHCVNIQGSYFSADHYHIQDISNGVRVTIWNDDPIDWPVGKRHARRWDILTLAPDESLGGAINTRQLQTIYAESTIAAEMTNPAQNTVFLDWTDFVQPPLEEVLHGFEVDQTLHEEHQSIRSVHGWREWGGGIIRRRTR